MDKTRVKAETRGPVRAGRDKLCEKRREVRKNCGSGHDVRERVEKF